jgi:hypothetical protein
MDASAIPGRQPDRRQSAGPSLPHGLIDRAEHTVLADRREDAGAPCGVDHVLANLRQAEVDGSRPEGLDELVEVLGAEPDPEYEHRQTARHPREPALAREQKHERSGADGQRGPVRLVEMGDHVSHLLGRVAVRALDAEQLRHVLHRDEDREPVAARQTHDPLLRHADVDLEVQKVLSLRART